VRELYNGECFNISPLPTIASQAKQAKCLTLCKRSFECSHAFTIASYTPNTCAWFKDPLYVFNTHTQYFSHTQTRRTGVDKWEEPGMGMLLATVSAQVSSGVSYTRQKSMNSRANEHASENKLQ
jgi:hypothetical protein